MPSTVSVSKLSAAVESAYRTFLQAAVPAFLLAVRASEGVDLKAIGLAAGGAALSAGIASVARLFAPLSTDKVGVGVE